MQLQTQFVSREELEQYLHAQFPGAAQRGPEISPIRGGRKAAEMLLQKIDPEQYASTRNMLIGSVTKLSPYLRHGVLALAEVRHSLLKHTPTHQAYKVLQELAWRDYFQRVYEQLGNDIWQDIEPYKTGFQRYVDQLPDDIKEGTTGLTCIDSFANDLRTTGYLHNHVRMWLAAYIVHHRRVHWQAGAYWFLQHLLDGDPASNNLSWQWVASTFAAKPYYFNRENLARYTQDAYCSVCPLLHNGCPFEGSYEEVAERIFPATSTDQEQQGPVQTPLMKRLSGHLEHNKSSSEVDNNPLTSAAMVWINEDSFDPNGPALSANPQATPFFAFDEATIESAGWTLKRIAFIYECLLEVPGVQIYKGASVEVLFSQLMLHQGQNNAPPLLATTASIDPRLQQIMSRLNEQVLTRLYEIEPFIRDVRIRDLRRFSRYWQNVEHKVISDEK